MEQKTGRSGSRQAPARPDSAVVGLAGGLLRPVDCHSAAHDQSQLSRDFYCLAQTIAAQQEDLGVFDDAVSDGDGGVKEGVAQSETPLCEGV